jgi:hypothetical protein
MRQQATIGALLLITVGVVLGATVFRTDIAQATGMTASASKGTITGGAFSWSQGCPLVHPIGRTYTANGIAVHMSAGVSTFSLTKTGSHFAFSTYGPALGGPADVVLSFPKPIGFDTVECNGSGTVAGGTVGNGK